MITVDRSAHNRYAICRSTLSSGTTGRVRLTKDGKYAIKTILQDHIANIGAELRLMTLFSHHPYVINLVEFYYCSENNRHKLDIVMKAGQVLTKVKYSVDDVIYQLIDLLAYMQDHGVIYGDIKPENIIIYPDDSGNIHLTDFGLHYLVGSSNLQITQTFGDLGCMARRGQMNTSEVYHPLPCAMWALGITIILLVRKGSINYDKSTLRMMTYNLNSVNLKVGKYDSLVRMLLGRPEDRPKTFSQLLTLEVFQGRTRVEVGPMTPYVTLLPPSDLMTTIYKESVVPYIHNSVKHFYGDDPICPDIVGLTKLVVGHIFSDMTVMPEKEEAQNIIVAAIYLVANICGMVDIRFSLTREMTVQLKRMISSRLYLLEIKPNEYTKDHTSDMGGKDGD